MWSVPARRWRTLVDYAGVAAEVAAAIVIGLLITMLVLTLNPDLARGAPADGVGRLTDHLANVAYRPSLAQVAARLPISSRRPSTPANIGSTPMPRTTLA